MPKRRLLSTSPARIRVRASLFALACLGTAAIGAAWVQGTAGANTRG